MGKLKIHKFVAQFERLKCLVQCVLLGVCQHTEVKGARTRRGGGGREGRDLPPPTPQDSPALCPAEERGEFAYAGGGAAGRTSGKRELQ